MKTDLPSKSPRNLQLDFFRGLALMIIFINHMPLNPWFAYTPSRLGPSDAAETFVFLSGFAAAIAFGRTFTQAGIVLGSVRVLFRCSQIYLAHLVLFFLMSALLVMVTLWDESLSQWQLDNLQFFFDHPQTALLALMSLHYVPNFIDILPMYLIILLWLPMIWALSRIHVNLALTFSVSLYAAAQYFGWELTADPVSGRTWYFNPFCWQLVFFTGFAFSSGWLSIPPFKRSLMYVCLAYVIFSYPLENAYGYNHLPWFATFRETWEPLLNKGHLGLLRYLHFLAMTYLVSHFMRKQAHWLESKAAQQIITMGQQSLPIFMLGTCLAFLCGVILDYTHADFIDSTWVNVAGLSVMILSARFLTWLDQKPWKNTVNAAPFTIGMEWPKQAMVAFSLLMLTAAPLKLLQSPNSGLPITVAAIPEPDLVINSLQDLALDADQSVTEQVTFTSVEPATESSETF